LVTLLPPTVHGRARIGRDTAESVDKLAPYFVEYFLVKRNPWVAVEWQQQLNQVHAAWDRFAPHASLFHQRRPSRSAMLPDPALGVLLERLVRLSRRLSWLATIPTCRLLLFFALLTVRPLPVFLWRHSWTPVQNFSDLRSTLGPIKYPRDECNDTDDENYSETDSCLKDVARQFAAA
jgi:hypothetical protein